MKKINLISLSLFAILSFIGCGSSSSSSDTATGYYVDSPVVGVDYVCGSQEGRTGSDGKFIYEKGEGCTFSLAGIKLRNVPADSLKEDGKIFENNTDVARFLQSLDNDGNPDNGIYISDEVRNDLPKSLAENGIDGDVVPTGGVLDGVVDSLHNDVPVFEGSVRTADEVTNHLEETRIKYFSL
jgi:hypothetical protein